MFKTLVLSGGALKGISILGALLSCEQQNFLNNIEIYIGTSIGAIICFLLTFSIKPYNIYQELLGYNIFFKISLARSEDETQGLLDTEVMFQIVEKMIKIINFKELTFAEHYELTKKYLIITSFNLSTCKEETFSYFNTPNMSIYEHLKRTSGIPIIFNTNKKFIDGGIWNNFPISYAKEYDNVLGITTTKYIDKRHFIINLQDYQDKFILLCSRKQKYALFLSGYKSACGQIKIYKNKLGRKRRNTI
jgi:predicted acylesterase/phospholipase RssA